jgi:amidophosphoribosyltransferase
MAQELGADSLAYLPLDALARCLEMPEGRLCRACVTGQYPTPAGQRRYELELVKAIEESGRNGRGPGRRPLARPASVGG